MPRQACWPASALRTARDSERFSFVGASLRHTTPSWLGPEDLGRSSTYGAGGTLGPNMCRVARACQEPNDVTQPVWSHTAFPTGTTRVVPERVSDRCAATDRDRTHKGSLRVGPHERSITSGPERVVRLDSNHSCGADHPSRIEWSRSTGAVLPRACVWSQMTKCDRDQTATPM